MPLNQELNSSVEKIPWMRLLHTRNTLLPLYVRNGTRLGETKDALKIVLRNKTYMGTFDARRQYSLREIRDGI